MPFSFCLVTRNSKAPSGISILPREAYPRVKRKYGLTREQAERVKLYAERAPLTDEFRDRDRKRLQAELVSMVRKREAVKRLPERAANWQAGRDPAFVAANEVWRREFNALLLDIDRTLTPAQRTRAYGGDREVQRGPFAQVTWRRVTLGAYWFNPGSQDAR